MAFEGSCLCLEERYPGDGAESLKTLVSIWLIGHRVERLACRTAKHPNISRGVPDAYDECRRASSAEK